MEIKFSNNFDQAGLLDAVVYFLDENKKPGKLLQLLNHEGDITNAIDNSVNFHGCEGQSIHIIAPNYAKAKHIFIVGVGRREYATHAAIQRVGAKIADLLNHSKIASGKLIIESEWKNDQGCMWSSMLLGMRLKNYCFNKYFVKKKNEHELTLKTIEVIYGEAPIMQWSYNKLDSIVGGINMARDLVTEPANVLYPEEFMRRCIDLEKFGVKVTVLDTAKMKEHGMHAMLGVGQASVNEPYTVIMEWKSEANSSPTIALAGKGVCFDTGGLNIKSASSNIADMKDDMGGAAVVMGAISSIAKQKLPVHVVGIIGLVENSVAGNAQRPSDVVTTMSGQTVEVENTDAEGRLVLCDIIWYVQQFYNPDYIIDVATLTGAVVIALGEGGFAGLFSNDDKLANDLLEVGKLTGEMLWRLPLAEQYDKQIDSEIADMRNTGTVRGGGATIAAQFLQRFIQPGRKWAHLDIANVAWNKKGTPLAPRGATGFGVHLLAVYISKLCNASHSDVGHT